MTNDQSTIFLKKLICINMDMILITRNNFFKIIFRG